MADTPENKPGDKGRQDNIKSYLRYSGMAFQMIGVMVLAAWAGMKLDAYTGNENPWFTILLLVVAVIASMVLVIMSLTKKGNK